jgi:hypothetical protein
MLSTGVSNRNHAVPQRLQRLKVQHRQALSPSILWNPGARWPAHLVGDGRAVIGFGAGRDYEFAHFLGDTAEAGFAPDLLLSMWNLRRFTDDSDFLVALLRPA